MRLQQSGYGRSGVGNIVRRGAEVLVCLLGLGTIVIGQGSSSWDPVKTVCNLVFARGVVLGDKMYVDGGEVMDQDNYKLGVDKPYYNSNMYRWQSEFPSNQYPIFIYLTEDPLPIFPDEHLWELDLSTKFNVSTPHWTAHPKPGGRDQHYNGAAGTLWNIGDGKFYTLGGWMSLVLVGPPPGHRIREPYFTQNSSGFYFHLPEPRIFAFDPKTGNWTSEEQKNIHRLTDIAYTQSARNKVGYTFGGNRVVEEDSSATDFLPAGAGAWVSTMSKYDFRTGKFNITDMPADVGLTKSALMHSLDRVGKEGVLIAFGGKSNNNNNEEWVSPFFFIYIYYSTHHFWE